MLKLKKTPPWQQDWKDLTYLLDGTATQQAAYSALDSLQMASLLQRFDPILVGTIPLDIDIPGSDLDIVCCTANVDDFAQFLFETFSHYQNFELRRKRVGGVESAIATFTHQDFPIELFGQPRPTLSQAAVRHLDVEARLLHYSSEKVRQQMRQLKSQGFKTEPAFAIAFSLIGDSYQALLDLSDQPDEVLISIISASKLNMEN
ncbi:hypothetical protein C1752_14312 [Acaryochloris thomasi RCC1774]|uniref:DUF4269 domain-containing protein n=1 Tax=Acaryochloris thomasi RCC1774 TaxID=1764569 RepID=A0A2W1JN22_9CYAN|nr:DUF4269 domain-containing protein [Acaryochloris thomasi]PZD70307.1 hypothetical protein C1752_14312 [Acaryochloris thomasi RCC1774]